MFKKFYATICESENGLIFSAYNNDFVLEVPVDFDIEEYRRIGGDEEATMFKFFAAKVFKYASQYNDLFADTIDTRFIHCIVNDCLSGFGDENNRYSTEYKVKYESKGLPIPFPIKESNTVIGETRNSYNLTWCESTDEASKFIEGLSDIYVENCKIFNDYQICGMIYSHEYGKHGPCFEENPGYTITSDNEGRPILVWPEKTSELE